MGYGLTIFVQLLHIVTQPYKLGFGSVEMQMIGRHPIVKHFHCVVRCGCCIQVIRCRRMQTSLDIIQNTTEAKDSCNGV